MFKNPITVSTGDWFQEPLHTPKSMDLQIPYTKWPSTCVHVNLTLLPIYFNHL